MRCKIILLLLAGLTVLGSFVSAEEKITEADIKRLIHDIDTLYRSEASYAELEMEIVTPHWQRTLSMDSWSEGMDKTFIRIKSPLKEKGVATLRIDNEMWNFLPKTNKVMKVPPSMMMSSWMGSDFTNDDLVKEFSLFEDYTYKLTTVEDAADSLIYIDCIPNEDLPIVWGNIVIAVSRNSRLPVWQRYFDEKGKLMRVMTYSDVREFGGRTIPAVMAIVPQNKEGHRTEVRYTRIDFNIKVGEDIFSLRNLRSLK